MSDNELLSAISDMMDKKLNERLKPINDRLDAMDKRFDKVDDTLNTLKFNQEHITEKLKGIEVTMNYNDYHLSHDIKKLQEDVDTITEILKINDMIPVAK